MPVPRPTQISGAEYLAAHRFAALGDAPRVGKTGAAIMAADRVDAMSILVITTSSGRGVWRRAFDEWSAIQRGIRVWQAGSPIRQADVVITSWQGIAQPAQQAAILLRRWELMILDESHFAKSFDAKRTRIVYGAPVRGGETLDNNTALAGVADRIWCLSGTLAPNSLFDLYPMLRALWPTRLDAQDGMPDVRRAQDFLHRYCVVRMKKISNFRRIPVIIGGRNEDELKRRLAGLILRRTQADVGITTPIYETWPLVIDEATARGVDRSAEAAKVWAAITNGSTADLEMHLGPLRRITGTIKAQEIARAIDEEFASGLDKVVLAYWHRDVGDILIEGLARHGVVRVDGATSARERDVAETRFRKDAGTRVFLAQIQAAGEAIDLSAAATLVFVESSFTPKDMAQMALRITNYTQERQPLVRVAALAGSIDEPLQQSLLRKWAPIKEVVK